VLQPVHNNQSRQSSPQARGADEEREHATTFNVTKKKIGHISVAHPVQKAMRRTVM